MILDLHLPKDWDKGADLFLKLRDSQVPILYPVAQLVVRDMPVTASIVKKAFATAGRDSRKEAAARAKSSAYAEAHLCRNHGLRCSGRVQQTLATCEQVERPW